MSSMADFASALSGAPPPGGPPTPGTPPPDTSSPPPDDSGGSSYSNSLEALDGAEEALQAFIQLDPDESDRAVAAQCLQNVIKLKASNQQSSQSGDLTSLQRALAGGAGAAPPGGAPVGQ